MEIVPDYTGVRLDRFQMPCFNGSQPVIHRISTFVLQSMGGIYITLLGPSVHTAEKEPLPYSGLNTNSCNRFDTFPSVSCL